MSKPFLALALLLLVPTLVGFDGAQARAALDRAFDNLFGVDILAGVELEVQAGTGERDVIEFSYGRKRKGGETRTLLFTDSSRRGAPRALMLQTAGEPDRMFVSEGTEGQVEPLALGSYGGQLFGSDFSYEDFRAHSAEEFRIEVLGEDKLEREPTRVVRLRPLSGPYTMVLVWLALERPVIVRMDYFDELGLWKRYRVDPSQLSDELGSWVPLVDEMFDLRTGSRTTRRIKNFVVDAEVPDELFSFTQLARGRLPGF